MPTAQTSSRTLALIPAGLAGVCLLLGGIFAAVGWAQYKTAEAARTWPSVEATITTSRVVHRQVRDRRDYTVHNVTSHEIEYQYAVAGRAFTGSSVDPPGFETSGAGDAELVAQFPVGAHPRVYYDPTNPSVAALRNAASAPRRYLFLIIGFIVMAIGAPFAALAIRWARSPPSTP